MRKLVIASLLAAGLALAGAARAQVDPTPLEPVLDPLAPALQTVCGALDCEDFCPVPPPTHELPASGQTTKYAAGDDGDIQAGATLSYTDNGNGTITDNNTGLMWEKKVALNGTGDFANLHDADNTYPWAGSCSGNGAFCGTDADCPANQFCNAGDGQTGYPNGRTIFKWVAALNAASFAGHNDWRVPNVKELQSIINYERLNPAVNPAFHGSSCGGACTDLTNPACSCTVSSGYWSGTTLAANPTNAWLVYFHNGTVNDSYKPYYYYGYGYVRAVRGGSL